MLTSARKIWQIFDATTKRRAFILLFMMILGSIAEAISVGMVFPLIQVALAPGEAADNFFVALIVDRLGISPGESVTFLFAAMFGFFLLKNAYLLFLVHEQGRFIWDTLASLWRRMYQRYLGQPYQFHMDRNSSELINNISSTLRGMFYSFVMPVINLVTELFVAVAICGLLLWSNPLITVGVLALLTTLVAAYYFLFRQPLSRWGANQILQQKSMIQWLTQGLAGIKEVKILQQEPYFERNFVDSSKRVAHYSRRNLLVTQMPRYMAETVVIGAILVTIYYVGVVKNATEEALPLMAMFTMAAFRLMPAISRIASYMGHIRFGGAALDTIYRDLTMDTGAEESETVDLAPIAFDQHLRIEEVWFRYSESGADVLKGVSLEISRGASIALIGPSGAGKTTLADLILGLYTPTHGRILSDRSDIAKSPQGWRRMVSCIPQKVFILDAPVWANIALGRNHADIDQDKLARILDQSQLTETVSEMPQGIDTPVGEAGARISGGQAQRIGIARSLYADADILIMDEATSALDSETEHAISKVIESMKGNKTLIMIAHRLSTVRNCDRLYYMKDGRIVDSGSFEELHNSNEEFREMVRKMDVSVV